MKIKAIGKVYREGVKSASQQNRDYALKDGEK